MWWIFSKSRRTTMESAFYPKWALRVPRRLYGKASHGIVASKLPGSLQIWCFEVRWLLKNCCSEGLMFQLFNLWLKLHERLHFYDRLRSRPRLQWCELVILERSRFILLALVCGTPQRETHIMQSLESLSTSSNHPPGVQAPAWTRLQHCY